MPNKDEMREGVKALTQAQKEAIHTDLMEWHERKHPKVYREGEGWVSIKKTIKLKDLKEDLDFILNHIIFK